MFPHVSLATELPWQPGPYPGVELCLLHRNPETGGVTVLRKFHAGVTVPAHVHPLANETAYVLQGSGGKMAGPMVRAPASSHPRESGTVRMGARRGHQPYCV